MQHTTTKHHNTAGRQNACAASRSGEVSSATSRLCALLPAQEAAEETGQRPWVRTAIAWCTDTARTFYSGPFDSTAFCPSEQAHFPCSGLLATGSVRGSRSKPHSSFPPPSAPAASAGGGAERAAVKAARRVHFAQAGSPLPSEEETAVAARVRDAIARSVADGGGRLSLIDIGSCYDPFSVFEEFKVREIGVGSESHGASRTDRVS